MKAGEQEKVERISNEGRVSRMTARAVRKYQTRCFKEVLHCSRQDEL